MSSLTAPVRLVVAQDAAILHFNGPAAVTLDGSPVVGWVDGEGGVRVRHIRATKAEDVLVHRFSGPDDHAAPALASMVGGEHRGKLLVATSHHSSDLFIYRARERWQIRDFQLVCRIEGRYTYPRLVAVARKMYLLVRQDVREATVQEDYRGALAIAEVRDDGCGPPVQLAVPEFRHWVYAGMPRVHADRIHLAWSIYEERFDRFNGAIVATYHPARGEMLSEQLVRLSTVEKYAQVWDHGRFGGELLLSVSHYTGAFGWRSGAAMGSIADVDGWRLNTVWQSSTQVNPHYPTGPIFNIEAGEVLLAELDAQSSQITRRRIEGGAPGEHLPSCDTRGVAMTPQPVHGAGSSYVFLEADRPISGKSYQGTRLVLCIIQSRLERWLDPAARWSE